MSTSKRPERVGQLVQEHLGALLTRGLKDPRLGLVTVTGTKVSPDLRQVRVYWTVHGDEKVRKATKEGLEAAKGFLRRELGVLGLRVVPELTFTYDEAIDRGDRIERLLREAKQMDQRSLAESEAQARAAAAAKPDEGEGEA